LRVRERIQNIYTLKLEAKQKMVIPYGRYTYGPQPKIIGYMPWVIKLAEGSRIGNFCSIGPDVKFAFLGKHDYACVSTYPFYAFYEKWGIDKNEFIKGKIDSSKIPSKPIVVENDVWIAKNATIMEGVKVGNGAVIAMEALVTKDVPPYAVVGGNPAKIIRFRFKEEQITELLNTSWWNWEDKDIKKAASLLLSNDIDGFLREAKGKYPPKIVHT
jgi:virginiamycin A acetyltransferase